MNPGNIILNKRKDNNTKQAQFEAKSRETFKFLFFKMPHLQFKYPLGVGAYGAVCAVEDTKIKKVIAVKRIGNLQNQIVAERTLREIKLLKHFQNQKYIIDLYNVQILDKDFSEVFLFQEIMETDLYYLIYFHHELISEQIIKKITFQIVSALDLLHSANIMHRDVKPSNCLIKNFCVVKLCDFGLARDMAEDFELSNYVQTRWYRAPELLFKNKKYTKKIDLWSVGCILAEMFEKTPLFNGKDSYDQLVKIIKILGKPSNKIIQDIEHDIIREQLQICPDLERKSLKNILPHANEEIIKLLDNLLEYDPDRRFDAKQILQSNYFKEFTKDDNKIYPCILKKVEAKNLKMEIFKECIVHKKSKMIEKTVRLE